MANLAKIFRAYDIRGVYPGEIDEAAVNKIARAYAKFLKPKIVAVGRDVRQSGPALEKALTEGLISQGVQVAAIGQVPTEVLYFAVGYYHYDGGIQVTASHNPAEFNGLKLVGRSVEAISSESGLKEIERLSHLDLPPSKRVASALPKQVLEDYFDHLTKFVEFDSSRPLKIVANNNFGLSGILAGQFLSRVKAEQINLLELNFRPDGNFPKGRPDPLIPASRVETSQMIRSTGADFGVAWDADGDRCFFFDERGDFIESSHVGAVLVDYLIKKEPAGSRPAIIYDPRNVWAMEEAISRLGGRAIQSKAGHTFIKNRMRQEGALFACETSGHYYFRDFFGADNGLIPFLLLLNIISQHNGPVSALFRPLKEKFAVSGEINFQIADKEAAIAKLEGHYSAGRVDRTDGLSVSFGTWRFNARTSNTEDLLRLNVEAKDASLCRAKTAELSHLLKKLAAK